MLTGLLQPSKGTATIHGFDIRTNMRDIRQIVGLCPQQGIHYRYLKRLTSRSDLLFAELTVKEHLEFYGKLKGLNGAKLQAEISYLLTKMGLEEKANSLCNQLSGGTMRKTSLAISMVGNAKVLFLDEPTSGEIPFALVC